MTWGLRVWVWSWNILYLVWTLQFVSGVIMSYVTYSPSFLTTVAAHGAVEGI